MREKQLNKSGVKQLTQVKQLNKHELKIEVGAAKYFLTCINNLLSEWRLMTTPRGESITRNGMTGTEQPDQFLLPNTEIGESVSIDNTLSTGTAYQTDPTIQLTIVHLNQATWPGHSDRNHFPIQSLNSGIDFPRSMCNIDHRTGM